MSITIPPPPTWASPVIPGPTGKPEDSTFNPVWLDWFVRLVAIVTQSSSGGGITHNLLLGLQGGAVNQYYHLSFNSYTRALANYATLPSAITVTASPFNYQNPSTLYDADVIVQGGTVSLIEFSRDNASFFTIGTTAGIFRLSPSDHLRVTYSAAPAMTLIPR